MDSMRRPAVVMLLWLVAPATAFADRQERPFNVEKGRQVSGAKPLPKQVAGVTVTPAEGVAARTQKVTLTLTDPDAGPVQLVLPERFGARSQNGRSYVPGRPSGSRRLDAGDTSISFDVSGLPAGTYALPIKRAGTTIGVARFRLYAPRKEGIEDEGEGDSGREVFGPVGRVPVDSSQDSTEESETFVALSPLDSHRIVAYGNDISGTGDGGVAVSNDGGATWAHPQFPHAYNTPTGVDTELPSGDPILAADDLGNVWAGGLSLCTSGAAQGRLFVNRIAAGTSTFQSRNAGLPFIHTGNSCDLAGGDFGVIQDKPQMTIDNSPSSPTYGRLYVTWDDPDSSGAVNEAITFCDTRPGGYPDAAHCDTGANWSTPAILSDAKGSYITSDVAVGPDGKVYVVWWDFSAANKISADMCDAAAHSCGNSAGWGADKTVASLSVHSGKRVPFQCNTLAQPGGRAAPVPSVAVDHSGGSNNGRIYVAWSDLDLSGTTRCSDSAANSPGTLTQDTFDSFVASAPDFATLTSGAPASGTRGTSIVTDTGDHWFPWVAIDQSVGQAYVDLYSTRDDATRTTSQFYKRSVTPGSGTPVTFGTLTKVSSTATNYSDTFPPGQFDNDYGDYTGLDAAQGVVVPVWTQRSLGGDGDVEVDLPSAQGPRLTADAPTLAESGGDGDGKLDPGESFTLTMPLRNNGPGTVDNVSAVVSAMSPGVTLTTADSLYGASIAAGSAAANQTTYTGTIGSSVPCGVNVDFRLAITTDQGPREVQVAPATFVCGAAPPPPQPPPTTTGTTSTPPPTTTTPATTVPTTPQPVDHTPPFLKLTLGTRADRKGRYTVKLAATGEAAAGSATLRLATGGRRKLASGLLASSGLQPLKLVLRLKKKDLALLKRKRKLRVTLTVSLTDVAGNTARGKKTFTLRLKR
jgi:hypothetical protein